MNALKIVCHPAECYIGCEEHDCHYTHLTTWHVGDEVFPTEEEAKAYVAKKKGRIRAMKLKLYAVQGMWYLGYELNGKIFLLTCKGRVGDCIQP